MDQQPLRSGHENERGTILLVIVFVATAIAALAAISSGRVVAEGRLQTVLESGTRAYNDAMGQIQLAMSVVNNSAYNNLNHNLELRASVAGDFGGTVAGDPPADQEWLRDPSGVYYGHVKGTEVRAYKAADYLRRIAKLKGLPQPTDPNLDLQTENYFVIEAQGRAGDQLRLVSALVRENQPFSSFVFFQNRHPLGVSGSPRGLIHSNDAVHFYFPDGNYVDGVSAVAGFDHKAGATVDNTEVLDGNPAAQRIDLDAVDFAQLRTEASLFQGTLGLDGQVQFYADGKVRIRQYTPPTFVTEMKTFSNTYISGYDTVIESQIQQVQVGTVTETRTRSIVTGYETEFYMVTIDDYEDQTVTKTRQVPILELQTVTKTRWVQIFVPYDSDAGGGTAVGGGGDTVPGDWVWVQEEYQTEENVVVGYNTETYTTTESVWVGSHEEQRSRQVPLYGTETYTVDVPVYEDQTVQVTRDVPIYQTDTWQDPVEIYVPTQFVDETWVDLKVQEGTIFIDGRITSLQGDLNGRVTVVGNEKTRITGNIRYVDNDGDTAMLNGTDYTQTYERNPDYEGNSTLGVITRDDLLFTRHMPQNAELNGTLMSTGGRVGIDGFAITTVGEPTKDYYYDLTAAERKIEEGYDKNWYLRTERFKGESLRRMGGIISNDRILETYIRSRSDGTSYVDSGFKRGRMRFDISLIFNPPPNFVEVPRPVLSYYAPVFFVRGEE